MLQSGERYFVQQRQPGKHLAGLWEFPGGKVEAGETAWSALVRELKEELGINALSGTPLITLTHSYPDRDVHLEVWRVANFEGDAVAQEQQLTAWRTLPQLRDMPLLPADLPVLDAMESRSE